MSQLTNRLGLVGLTVMLGCGSGSMQEPAAAPPEGTVMAEPPPPPSAPPPDVDTASQQVPAAPAQTSPQAPATGASQAGPLPPLPSSAPQGTSPPGNAQPGPQPQPPVAEEIPPSAAQWVYSYPTGQWVYMSSYGWVWVPAGADSVAVEGVPYVYLYTPAFGWTWYVSPWGWGPYRYGIWVRHPFVPRGWRRAWVAHPHVVVHLGHRRYRR